MVAFPFFFFQTVVINCFFRLEDTLIDLYLSGYSNQAVEAGDDDVKAPLETEDADKFEFPADGLSSSPVHLLFWMCCYGWS